MGWIYALTNPSMKGMVKIGQTSRKDVQKRIDEISSATGVPTPFVLVHKRKTDRPLELEQLVHHRLCHYRVNKKREFFRCSLWRIRRAIRIERGGIDWEFWFLILSAMAIAVQFFGVKNG